MSSQENIRAELIQVAAVAIAILTDLDQGFTKLESVQDYRYYTEAHSKVMKDVVMERAAQERKWGPQHHDIFRWLAILGEEYGEACQAAVDLYIGGELDS